MKLPLRGWCRLSSSSSVRPHDATSSHIAETKSAAQFLGLRVCLSRRHCICRHIHASRKSRSCCRSFISPTPALYLLAVEGWQTKARSAGLPGVSKSIASAVAEQHGRSGANTSSLQEMRDPLVRGLHIFFLVSDTDQRRMRFLLTMPFAGGPAICRDSQGRSLPRPPLMSNVASSQERQCPASTFR
jgi:hypothetical protein